MKPQYRIIKDDGAFWVQRRFLWIWWHIQTWHYDWEAGYYAADGYGSLEEAKKILADIQAKKAKPVVVSQ